VNAKRGWVSLARNRRSPKRPSEPPSGGPPGRGGSGEKDGGALYFGLLVGGA
jgi:hypothetical protein